MKHLLLILISTLWSMAATAQDHGIYVNGDWKSSTLDASNINKTSNDITNEDVIDVVLSSYHSLSLKSAARINKGTWTFHGNGNEIPITCTAENAKLDIKESSVTFENCYIENMRFSVSNASVTFTDDCTVNGATFSFEQGESTITFTSGSYSGLSAEVNSSALFVIAGGTFHDCSDFFCAGTVTLAEGIMLCDPDSGEPLTIDSSGRIVDANGLPASVFTCREDTADPVISYTTSTGQSGTFTSVSNALTHFANTKDRMRVNFTLLEDVTADGRLLFDGMDAILNLGSHRIRFDKETGNKSTYQVVLFDCDVSICADEDGGMDFDYIEPEGTTLISGVAVNADATLTITSGSYRGHGLIITCYGTVNITGGTFHSTDYATVYWRDGQANVSGGRFSTDSNGWAAVYSNGSSLVNGYSYWIHDSGVPVETIDEYNPDYGGYIYNQDTMKVGFDVSVGRQTVQARVTADGQDLYFDSVAEALEEAQNHNSALVTFVGEGDYIGCRDYAVIERGNITIDFLQKLVFFTSRHDQPAITINGGTVTAKGDNDNGELGAYRTLFDVNGTSTLNVESGVLYSRVGNAISAPGEDTHINISNGILYSESPDHCTVDLHSKHANITGGIFYNSEIYCSLYSSEPCMSDELSFYYEGSIDPENELSFTPGDYLVTLYGSPVYYAVVAPSTGPRFTVTAHDGTQTTTQKFYSFEKALAFATEHESAHIDVHQHDYKWGAYRMDKGNVTIDLHNNYINSLYDFYISTEPQFFHYVQHPDDYGAIVVSGGCLTINDDINSRGFFSYQGCIVASGHGTIVLNGGYHNSNNGIGIVACEQGEITINNGKYISTYTYKDKEDERYNSASIAALGEGHIRINGGSFQGLTPLYVHDKGKIDVYGGHFKSYEGAPAVTLDDGITLYGGHFTCTKGHSAIVYPNPDYYMHHFYDAANNFYDYYTGEMMLMTRDRSGSNHFVIYADDALTVYANDVYLAPKPIFQIQHLTHIIDEAKKGRASISDVESMVQKVLKN